MSIIDFIGKTKTNLPYKNIKYEKIQPTASGFRLKFGDPYELDNEDKELIDGIKECYIIVEDFVKENLEFKLSLEEDNKHIIDLFYIIQAIQTIYNEIIYEDKENTYKYIRHSLDSVWVEYLRYTMIDKKLYITPMMGT